ncbi:MAG: hypothetical protein LUF35_07520 [Lachnospiraceae bacterium]|nr:hypothetical protein [Lachnospiraceae bacterium]
MADTKLDIEKANAWKSEVEAELADVKVLLRNVYQECEERPEDDDTLLNAFYEAGLKMESTWTELSNQFDKTVSGLQEVINQWKNTIEEKVSGVKELVSKIANV